MLLAAPTHRRLLSLLCAIAAAWPSAGAAQGSAVPGLASGQLAPFTAPIAPPPTQWPNGVSTLLHFDADTLAVIGGTGARQAVSVAAFQAGLSLDTARAGWWTGGRFDLMTMGLRNDGNLQTATGDVQLPSNLWAPNFLRLYQFSYRQDIGAGFVQGGIMDVNNRFDVTEVAGHLHNASFGIAPTLTSNADIATFPNPGLGLVVGSDLGNGLSVQGGLWQGDPPGLAGALARGALAVAEVDKVWGGSEGTGTTLKFGLWQQHQHGLPSAGGAYAIAEHGWRDAGRRDWGLFFQAGDAPQESSPVSAYVGAGVRVRGINPDRPGDVVTVGIARARLRDLQAETVFEIVYSTEIAPHVYLQPDLQRIAHPGGGPGMQTIAGLRVHIER